MLYDMNNHDTFYDLWDVESGGGKLPAEVARKLDGLRGVCTAGVDDLVEIERRPLRKQWRRTVIEIVAIGGSV